MTQIHLLTGVLLLLAGLLIFHAVMFHVERKREEARQEKLLNRIMARDYTMLVQGEVAKTHAEAAAKRETTPRPEEEVLLDVT